MNLIEKFTVLEDGEPIGTFDTYEQAADDIRGQAIIGRRYQVVKEFVTDEEPRHTIADTGWRDEYRGMWAEGTGTGRLYVLLSEDDDMVFATGIRTCEPIMLLKERLVPRPDLAPVSLTPHPAYLETTEDYEGAPEFTVIACRWTEERPTYVKDVCGEWVAVGGANSVKTANLGGTRRRVLYWPKEEA